MAEFIQCRWCEHCDTNRKNGDKVRCKRYSQWVDPCGYGISGCKNYDYYQREEEREKNYQRLKKRFGI